MIDKVLSEFVYAQKMSGITASNMTKYIDPYGRFLINYPFNWTAHPVANALQQCVVLFTNMVSFLSFSIVIGSAALPQTDPASVLNEYGIFPSTVPAGYSVSQNVECEKYKIDGYSACSIVLIGMRLEKSLLNLFASHVNNKMFIFTMHATRNDFERYIPTFKNMIDSFRAPATSVNINPAYNGIMNQTTPSNNLRVKTLPMNPMCPPYIRCVS